MTQAELSLLVFNPSLPAPPSAAKWAAAPATPASLATSGGRCPSRRCGAPDRGIAAAIACCPIWGVAGRALAKGAAHVPSCIYAGKPH